MRALILVNGELYQPDILHRRIRAVAFDLVLGADRGARHGATLGVTLDAIVSDLDSLSDSERAGFVDVEFMVHPAEKDETDLELALLYAAGQGADRIVLVGAMGGRLDMSLANILLLTQSSLSACRVEVWHGVQTGWLIRPPGGDIWGRPGDTLSLIPLAGAAQGVTTAGLKYPLKDETLSFGPARGLSNRLERPAADIKIVGGLLLAVHTPGRA